MRSIKKYIALSVLHHFPDRAGVIMMGMHRHFEMIAPDIAFAATSTNPLDKRMEVCGWILALIKTLDASGTSYEDILKVCQDIATNYVQPKNRLHRAIKKLPARWAGSWLANFLFRRLGHKVSKRSHPDGFSVVIHTDPKITYGLGFGFDILECGICKLFNRHHLERYTSILCEVDKITSEMAGLKLIRKSTIAMGADKCDFRYQKLDRS